MTFQYLLKSKICQAGDALFQPTSDQLAALIQSERIFQEKTSFRQSQSLYNRIEEIKEVGNLCLDRKKPLASKTTHVWLFSRWAELSLTFLNFF